MEISFYNEFKRKGIHLFALGAIAIDIIRLKRLPLHGFLNRLLGPVLREHESADFAGASYILSASFFTILFFDKRVAMAAISFIILGDIAAALIGRRFGNTKIRWSAKDKNVNWNNRKSVEGSLACLFVCILAALVVPHLPLWVGILGAFVATVVEALPLPINDNFSVPLLSGLFMHLLLQI